MDQNKKHWQDIYLNKTPDQVSWTQEKPTLSLELIESFKLNKDAAIIDVGAGDSNLVDYLLQSGFTNITVLDISLEAIQRAKNRLGAKGHKVNWVVSDVLDYVPTQSFDLWHDRAAFHFQCDSQGVSKYVEITNKWVKGKMIISTFSVSGPLKCSGLNITQYDKQSLADTFKDSFVLRKTIDHQHITPFNTVQNFIYGVFDSKEFNK
ncbi:class I SAM-dependent methyltransferase [Myroides sp. LJL119]